MMKRNGVFIATPTSVYDQEKKDGTTILGAITLGYITEERISKYLNNLK